MSNPAVMTPKVPAKGAGLNGSLNIVQGDQKEFTWFDGGRALAVFGLSDKEFDEAPKKGSTFVLELSTVVSPAKHTPSLIVFEPSIELIQSAGVQGIPPVIATFQVVDEVITAKVRINSPEKCLPFLRGDTPLGYWRWIR